MTSYRRVIMGSMGECLYKKLGSEPDVDVAWNSVRDMIGQHTFGQEFVPVPHLSSSVYYNQMFVFTKKRQVMERLGVRVPTYKLVGNMDYLVNRDLSKWTPQCDFSSWDVADTLGMYPQYLYRLHSESDLGPPKMLDITIVKPHTRRSLPPTPGKVIIYRNLLQDLREANSIYVITDVVLASTVKVKVMFGENQEVFIHEHDTPIGFRYLKYQIGADGTLFRQLYTNLKILQKDANWLVPNPQPIPRHPSWGPLHPLHNTGGSRRRGRNNLTMHTPEGRPRRQGWMAQQFTTNNSVDALIYRLPNGIVRDYRNDYNDGDDVPNFVLHQQQAIDLEDLTTQPRALSLSLNALNRNNAT